MTKRGNALKVKDLVKRLVDKNGKPSEDYHSWEVVELKLHDSLRVKDMAHGEFNYIYERKFGGLVKCQLVSIDIGDGTLAMGRIRFRTRRKALQMRLVLAVSPLFTNMIPIRQLILITPSRV